VQVFMNQVAYRLGSIAITQEILSGGDTQSSGHMAIVG
jgi:hypothetical protein